MQAQPRKRRSKDESAIAGTVLAAWLCSLVHAQSAADVKPAEAKLEFEVASIRPSVLPGRGVIRIGPRGGPGNGDPGRVTYTFSTIRDLMVDPYSAKSLGGAELARFRMI